MSWQNYPNRFPEKISGTFGSFSANEQCFIRKEHKCGKMYGASKSCFIACPTNDDLEPILSLMSEKLSRVGIEPIIAVKERAYGQDIFCTKICGKIIESRFCIVILDDSIRDDTNIPNPNVYYEYGLMTALRKHIIPLQKDDLVLAFNIQSYDTIKYNNRNVTNELDRAIRDAIKLTETIKSESANEPMNDKFILRRMELAGLEAKDDRWILSDAIDDTALKGFGHHEKGFYAYVGKVDDENDAQTYIDDLSVVIYRTDRKIKSLQEKLNRLENYQEVTDDEIEFAFESRKERIDDLNDKLRLMSKIFFVFIIKPELDSRNFLKSASKILKESGPYNIACSQNGKIRIDDVIVDLEPNQRSDG